MHGAAFVLFGLAAAGMEALADREPRLLFAFVMLFWCFEVFFAVLVVTSGSSRRSPGGPSSPATSSPPS